MNARVASWLKRAAVPMGRVVNPMWNSYVSAIQAHPLRTQVSRYPPYYSSAKVTGSCQRAPTNAALRLGFTARKLIPSTFLFLRYYRLLSFGA